MVTYERVGRDEKVRSQKDLCVLIRSLDFILLMLSLYAEAPHGKICVLGLFFNNEENRFLVGRRRQECCRRERVGV